MNLSLPLDGRVVAFTTGLSLVAALLSGLAPALQASKADVVSALKAETQGPADRLRLRNAFVVAQVAFSILLVVGGRPARTRARAGQRDRPGIRSARRRARVASICRWPATPEATGPAFARALRRSRARSARRAGGDAGGSHAQPGVIRTMLGDGLTVPGVTPPNGQPFSWRAGRSSSPDISQRCGFRSWRAATSAPRTAPASRCRHHPRSPRRGSFWPGQNAVGKYVMSQTGRRNSTGRTAASAREPAGRRRGEET